MVCRIIQVSWVHERQERQEMAAARFVKEA